MLWLLLAMVVGGAPADEPEPPIQTERVETHPRQFNPLNLYGGLRFLVVHISRRLSSSTPNSNVLVAEGNGVRRFEFTFNHSDMGVPHIRQLTDDEEEEPYSETDTRDVPSESYYVVNDTGRHRIDANLPPGLFDISLRVLTAEEMAQVNERPHEHVAVPLQDLPPTEETHGQLHFMEANINSETHEYYGELFGSDDPDVLDTVVNIHINIGANYVGFGDNIPEPNLGDYGLDELNWPLGDWFSSWMERNWMNKNNVTEWSVINTDMSCMSESRPHRFGEPMFAMISGYNPSLSELNPARETVWND
jgi:hypothetical protein